MDSMKPHWWDCFEGSTINPDFIKERHNTTVHVCLIPGLTADEISTPVLD